MNESNDEERWVGRIGAQRPSGGDFGAFRGALPVLAVVLFAASIPMPLCSQPEAIPAQRPASRSVEVGPEREGVELARRLGTGRTDAVEQEVRSWVDRLEHPDAAQADAAIAVLRAAVADLVAPISRTGAQSTAAEAVGLRALFEILAAAARRSDERSSSTFWNALEVVTEPLATGDAVLRTRLAEMLLGTLSPPDDWLEGRLLAWDLIRHGTSSLETSVSAVDRIEPDGLSEIQLTVLSAPTGWVRVEEVERLIEDLTRWDPERRIVLLADGSNFEHLVECCASDVVAVRPSFGRPFSPWPRDAMTFARSGDGSPLLLLRSNSVRGRELDALMGRSLLQFDDLAGAAGRPVRWLTSPVPFHNGQLLFTPGETWLSIHALERRALELLGLDSVPTATFSSQQGLDRYLDALRRAAGEIELLFSQPVDLVHPLPTSGRAEQREAQMWRLAGGAGWDLDSLVTILPRVGDMPMTLVGSSGLGQALLSSVDDEELRHWLGSLRLDSVSTEAARAALVAPLARRGDLQQYLDVVADHLERAGHEVVRVPILVVPQSLAPELETDVLIGIHNVVLERGQSSPGAEGFRTDLASLDEIAVETYRRAGYELRLLQPITDSVLRNAGYRCSTNHMRSGEAIGPGELRRLTPTRSVEIERRDAVP